MHWSAFVLLTAGLTAPQLALESPAEFDSYTRAYRAVGEVHKPMLLILNPPVSEVSTAEPITVEQLRADEKIGPLLDKYVVAVVDTGTEHGKEVHRRFGSVQLPYVAVIDEKLQKQVYRSTTPPTVVSLRTVVARYKAGVPATMLPPSNCPACQRNWMNF